MMECLTRSGGVLGRKPGEIVEIVEENFGRITKQFLGRITGDISRGSNKGINL